MHFSHDSVVTGPTGKTISLDAHQNAEFTPQGINTLTGQGPNVRAPGHGLLYQDVGRLVFDDSEWALLPCSSGTAPQSTERR